MRQVLGFFVPSRRRRNIRDWQWLRLFLPQAIGSFAYPLWPRFNGVYPPSPAAVPQAREIRRTSRFTDADAAARKLVEKVDEWQTATGRLIGAAEGPRHDSRTAAGAGAP